MVPNINVDTYMPGGVAGFDEVLVVAVHWCIFEGSLWLALDKTFSVLTVAMGDLKEEPDVLADWSYLGRREVTVSHEDEVTRKLLNTRRECVYYWGFECSHWNPRLNVRRQLQSKGHVFSYSGPSVSHNWVRVESGFKNMDAYQKVHASQIYEMIGAQEKGCVALPTEGGGCDEGPSWPKEIHDTWGRNP
jgi:hypothetical protein